MGGRPWARIRGSSLSFPRFLLLSPSTSSDKDEMLTCWVVWKWCFTKSKQYWPKPQLYWLQRIDRIIDEIIGVGGRRNAARAFSAGHSSSSDLLYGLIRHWVTKKIMGLIDQAFTVVTYLITIATISGETLVAYSFRFLILISVSSSSIFTLELPPTCEDYVY